LFLFFGFSGWRHYSRRYQNDAQYRVYRGAAKKAHLALKRASRNSSLAYSMTGKILIEYLSEKLNQPLAGLTLGELSAALSSFGINRELVDQVQSCIMLSEIGSYSPDNHSLSSNEFIQQVDDLITKLDKEL
jgi:hypothetical protein